MNVIYYTLEDARSGFLQPFPLSREPILGIIVGILNFFFCIKQLTRGCVHATMFKISLSLIYKKK